jgi:MtN3 and saliva related transmembrane protein
MEMNAVSILGLVAGACTSLSFVPQVIKVYRTKSTHDISLAMFLIFFVGIFLWLAYGILLRATPIVIANSTTFILAGIVLAYKLKYK